MKVAILTFHNAINYGAALQVFATQKAITNLGIDCVIIDYVNENRKNLYNMLNYAKIELRNKRIKSSARYFIGSMFMRSRKLKFLDFYNRNLVSTSIRYTCSEEAKSLNKLYDKFIVGSDQVWNYHNNGEDFAYLLDFVEDNDKKISYSSSFGLATIPDSLKKKYVENLSNIKHLSTREEYGVDLIEEMVGRKAQLVLDPVFLLDRNQWLSICSKSTKKENYVFAYTNKYEQWENFTKQTKYPMEGKKIYKISRHINAIDFLNKKTKVCYSISPEEFIDTIANAELVVSASFHCIALAIILNIQFVAILTGDLGKDERILNILRISGLESRVLTNSMSTSDVLSPIDFKLVEDRTSKLIDKSKEFLKSAILT